MKSALVILGVLLVLVAGIAASNDRLAAQRSPTPVLIWMAICIFVIALAAAVY